MSARRSAYRLGLISDTHGLLRPEVMTFLRGCDGIIHAGDIGGPDILQQLRSVAPVTAVRGNNDTGPWATPLQAAERVMVHGVQVYAIHDMSELAIDPVTERMRVVVSGHSHKPSMQERGGVLFVNPGSAGPRRFKLPIALGEIFLEAPRVTVRVMRLDDGEWSVLHSTGV